MPFKIGSACLRLRAAIAVTDVRSPALLLSLHDVTPETLEETGALLTLLDRFGLGPVRLLVVPGRDWTARQIAVLGRWQRDGHELVGHGWHHRAAATRGWRHRLHSVLISRGVAEHLALDADGIEALIVECHAWFVDNGLGAPHLYVPPAWAMGPISKRRLQDLPFLHYEVLSGIIDAASGRFNLLPLVGFEADTIWRALLLRLSNAVNVSVARRFGFPLRIAIHPHDLSLHMAEDLVALIARARRSH